jgi:uroporphyrinogen-III synthase
MLSPVFRIVPLEWEAPDASAFDALVLTSANAPRHAGPQLTGFTHLPCFAVGEATAAGARAAGVREVRTGSSDGQAALDLAADAGARRLLHLCGREHVPLERPGVTVTRRLVYAAEPEPALPQPAMAALAEGAVALIHSPRAAAHFAHLVDAVGIDRGTVPLAAISAAAAEAAGTGWKDVTVAPAPRDEALLELAAELCQTGAGETGNKA